MTNSKVLAIDYGTKRVGIAVSYGTLAEPLTILENDDTVFARLVELLVEQQATAILVGVSESKTLERTMQFIATLKQHTKLPVHLADETLSTQSARQKLEAQGKTKYQAQTAHVDHLAAANILQEWLDTHPTAN